MPVFSWTGTTTDGEHRGGDMNAASKEEVAQKLRAQQINVNSVKAKKRTAWFSSLRTSLRVVTAVRFSPIL